MSKEYFGILEAWDCPIAGGVIWCLYTGDPTKKEWSFEKLIPIVPGDDLKILNSSMRILWSGKVRYGAKIKGKTLGNDKSISADRWGRFFFNSHLAILTTKD